MEFEEFVTSRGEVLLRFAVAFCGDRGRAEDLVQAALIKAYPRWARVSAMEHPEAYLRTIIVRDQLHWWRRRSSAEVPAVLVDEDLPGGVDVAQRHADRDEAWRLLACLPPKQRAVLVLRYYEDLPDGEIARTLGCRESTVRSQAARALAYLRDHQGALS